MTIVSSEKGSQGFTLMELLITMLIMVLVLFALSALKNATLRSTVSAQQVTEASACAEQIMEKLIGQGYGSVSKGTAMGSCPDDQFSWETTVSAVGGGLNLKKITVEVSWFRGSVSLKTLLSDI